MRNAKTYEKGRNCRVRLRNDMVRKFFTELEAKNPQWKLTALLEETANTFPPISVNTVSAIIRKTGVYADS